LSNQFETLLGELKFNEEGLIPAIVQSATSKSVLMMAWMNRESLNRTFQSGETVFWSRSRQELWHKGATSGNTQSVREISADCDGDTLLILVDEHGPACHTDAESCFDVSTLFISPDFAESRESDGGANA
jgi:phosphoribosyl-AMP cyclohydrolase